MAGDRTTLSELEQHILRTPPALLDRPPAGCELRMSFEGSNQVGNLSNFAGIVEAQRSHFAGPPDRPRPRQFSSSGGAFALRSPSLVTRLLHLHPAQASAGLIPASRQL